MELNKEIVRRVPSACAGHYVAVIDPEAETRCIKAFVDINELNYFHSPDAMGIGLSEELVCKVLTG